MNRDHLTQEATENVARMGLPSSPTRCVDCGRETVGVWRNPVTCEDCEQKHRDRMTDILRKAQESTKELRERERAGEFVGQDVMEFRMQ